MEPLTQSSLHQIESVAYTPRGSAGKGGKWLNRAIPDTSHKMAFRDANTARKQVSLPLLCRFLGRRDDDLFFSPSYSSSPGVTTGTFPDGVKACVTAAA